jgi:hypothetical protein
MSLFNNNSNNNDPLVLQSHEKDKDKALPPASSTSSTTIITKRQLIASLQLRLNNSLNTLAMASEEISQLQFTAAIQEQKISQLETLSTRLRIEQEETSAARNKKHKSEMHKLMREKVEYEERANEMIKQMNEQMSTLQAMAMNRIEVLYILFFFVFIITMIIVIFIIIITLVITIRHQHHQDYYHIIIKFNSSLRLSDA